jgi:hypothetical protein
MNRVDQLKIVQNEGLELFRKKNQDYGDAFATYGTVGVLVRIGDKIQRLQSITNKGITLVQDERLRDTLIDLHNYAGMAVMLMDEKDVPVEKPKKYDDDFINNNLPEVASQGHELSEMDSFEGVWGQFTDKDVSGN